LKAYSTDFDGGYVAVVIDESNLDQPLSRSKSISSLRQVGECSAFFPCNFVGIFVGTR